LNKTERKKAGLLGEIVHFIKRWSRLSNVILLLNASNNGDHALQSLLLLVRVRIYNIIILLFFAHIPFVVNHTFNAMPPEKLQQ